MQNTEHDEINKKDPQWVQWLRRIGFLMMASSLGFAISYEASQASLFFVYATGTYSLVINSIALRLRRTPPRSGSSTHDTTIDHYISLLRDDLRGLDRGQLLTHLLLQQILNNQELEPDPAVIEDSSSVVFPSRWRKT